MLFVLVAGAAAQAGYQAGRAGEYEEEGGAASLEETVPGVPGEDYPIFSEERS